MSGNERTKRNFQFLLAVIAIGVMASVNAQAGREIMLHPGYIDVNVSISD